MKSYDFATRCHIFNKCTANEDDHIERTKPIPMKLKSDSLSFSGMLYILFSNEWHTNRLNDFRQTAFCFKCQQTHSSQLLKIKSMEKILKQFQAKYS